MGIWKGISHLLGDRSDSKLLQVMTNYTQYLDMSPERGWSPTTNLLEWTSQRSPRLFVQYFPSVLEGRGFIFRVHLFSQHKSNWSQVTWCPTVFLVYSNLN